MKNKLHNSKVNFRVLHNTSVPNQYEVRVNGNPQNKWTSRICQGATPLFFGSLGRISRWNPLGTCIEFFFSTLSLYIHYLPSKKTRVLLRLVCQEQFCRVPICETPPYAILRLHSSCSRLCPVLHLQ